MILKIEEPSFRLLLSEQFDQSHFSQCWLHTVMCRAKEAQYESKSDPRTYQLSSNNESALTDISF